MADQEHVNDQAPMMVDASLQFLVWDGKTEEVKGGKSPSVAADSAVNSISNTQHHFLKLSSISLRRKLCAVFDILIRPE